MNKCHSSVSAPMVRKRMQDLKLALRNNSHNFNQIAFHPQCSSLKLRCHRWRLTSLTSPYQWITFSSCWGFTYTYVRYLLVHTCTLWKVLTWAALCMCVVYETGILCVLFRICWIYIFVTTQGCFGRKDMKSYFASLSEYTISLAFKNTLCRCQPWWHAKAETWSF